MLAGSILQLYFNQVVGLPAVWVGAAVMVTLIVDSLVDPLIGRFSDNLRTPLGRRHALMYAAALPSALAFFLMWHAPQSLGAWVLLVFVILMLLFARVAISFYEIPSAALAPELAPEYDDRTKLFAWRFLFLILGGAVVNGVLYQVFLRQDAANPLGVLNQSRYAEFGIFASIVVFAAILISTAATHSRIRHLHIPPARKITMRETFAEVKATFSHRPLLILMVTGLMIGMAAGLSHGLSAYMYLHLWGLKPQQMSFVLFLGPMAAFISLWAAPQLSRRFGKKPTMVGFYAAWLLISTLPFSAWLLGLMPKPGSDIMLWLLIGDQFLALGLATGGHILLNSMLSDATDDLAVQTRFRSEGVMFAAYGLLGKWGAGLGAFVAGLLLTLVKFPDKAAAGTVPVEIMRNLVLIDLPVILVCNACGIICISLYGLNRRTYETNLTALGALEAGDPTGGPEKGSPPIPAGVLN